MEDIKTLLRDMSAGELVEYLLVNQKRQMDDFLWMEQVEAVLTELKTRLKEDQTMSVKNIIQMVKNSAYR